MAIISRQMAQEMDCTRANKRGEAARVAMVRIIFIMYWLLIIEGALRKWALPALQKPLFFILVPFAIWLYGISLMKNRWPRAMLLSFSYLLAGGALLLIPVQMIIGHYALRYGIIAGYGWLNYFFYIPLTFIIAKEFNQDDVRRFLRHTLWVGILSAPVVAMQFVSPPDSIINAGDAANTANQFHQLGSALGHIRPAGFFSSSIGVGLLITTLTIAVLYGWITSAQNGVARRWILILATLALLSMLAFSGNRGALVGVAQIFIATAVAGYISNRRQLAIRAGLLPLLAIVLLIVLWPIVLPNAYETFVTRWTEAAEVSKFALGPFGRALYSFYGWIYYLNTPATGYLLGIATNAAARLSWVHMPEAAYTWTGYGLWARESAWAVQLVDLGIVLGFYYIIFRVWFTLWLLKKAWLSTKKNCDPLALMLFGFAGTAILLAQFTVQGTVSGYTWIFLGVAISATKLRSTTTTKTKHFSGLA